MKQFIPFNQKSHVSLVNSSQKLECLQLQPKRSNYVGRKFIVLSGSHKDEDWYLVRKIPWQPGSYTKKHVVVKAIKVIF